MPHTERRHVARRHLKLPVTLTMAADSLDGETIDVSSGGVLVQSKGCVTITLHFGEGKELRGRLVRATPVDKEATAYAFQFDELTVQSTALSPG